MPSQKVYFSIPPLNDQSTAAAGANATSNITGGFSNKNGNANIKFALGSQDRLLDTSDMYLTGRIIYVKSDGVPLTQKDSLNRPVPGTATTKANYSLNNGANLQAVSNQQISNFAGVDFLHGSAKVL